MRKCTAILAAALMIFGLCSCKEDASPLPNDFSAPDEVVQDNILEEDATTTVFKQSGIPTSKQNALPTTNEQGQAIVTNATTADTTTVKATVSTTTDKTSTTKRSTVAQSTTRTTTGSSANKPQTSAWDGKTATIWSKGSGTAGNPYVIETAANLAYLAQKTVSGSTFENQYFILSANINLNNHGWTPIGTKSAPFSGVFDGDGYTVSNVKLSKGHQSVSNETKYERRGLFGHTRSAIISNLYINGVSAEMKPTSSSPDVYYVGGLIGYAESDYDAVIENCRIQNISFTFNATGYHVLYLGGVVGFANPIQNTTIRFSRVFADAHMTVKSDGDHRVGGIVGYINLKGVTNLTDVCSYLTISQSTREGKYYVSPTIGAVNTETGSLNLTSCYSSLYTNDVHFNLTGNNGHENKTRGFIGQLFGKFKGKSKFTNLFATVRAGVDKQDYSSQFGLYPIGLTYYDALTANNCKAVSVLPDTCGFKSSVWDLSDMSKPKLK